MYNMENKLSANACAQEVRTKLFQIYLNIHEANKDNGYVLIDFPDHSNVGDSAIWAGEIAAANSLSLKLSDFSCRISHPLDKLKNKIKDETILLHGGGNFGDIWTYHQEVRNNILRAFPKNRIIQLPQSIQFNDANNIKATSDAINSHENYTLLVRDIESLELAKNNFKCETLLCPDSAFALGPLKRTSEVKYEVLLLLRTDIEKRQDIKPSGIDKNWYVCDWLTDENHVRYKALFNTLINLLKSEKFKFTRDGLQFEFFNTLANMRVKRGLDLLSSGKIIITDRLHVHILSTLLGIPHIVLDNNYQKIKRFSNAFNTSWDGVKWAGTIEEAIEMAKLQI